MGAQALEEFQLIGEFIGIDRLAVRHVGAGDADGAAGNARDGFDIAGLQIGIVTSEAARDIIEREFGKDGDAVVCFLAVESDVVTIAPRSPSRERHHPCI